MVITVVKDLQIAVIIMRHMDFPIAIVRIAIVVVVLHVGAKIV